MDIDTKFDDDNLKRIEALLLAHPVARAYFHGVMFDLRGQRIGGMDLQRAAGTVAALDAATACRLFMILDDSVVRATNVSDSLGMPFGIEVRSTNPFLADDEQNSVIAFHQGTVSAIRLDALHIGRMMLAPDAPARLGTIAFGLMAVTAYRLGFSYISLFAAGHVPLCEQHSEALVGYAVWPKFGFDTALEPVDLNRFSSVKLGACRGVQDVIAVDPELWTTHGSARNMRFDLKAKSRSWSILLNYLYGALVEEEP